MTLADAVRRSAADVDQALDQLLPQPHGFHGRVQEAMRYAVQAGGKRLRPFLVLETASLFGAPRERAMRVACDIECLHTYSLVHDDLPAMDDDDLRRGRPTNHKAFGENVAILAGDGLYAEAFRHVLTRQQGEPQAILAAVGELATATGVNGMVGGQYLDVTDRAAADDEGLRTVHVLKTGKLIAASVLCPLRLVLAGEPARIELFHGFASELGVLFQIVDDILDVTGSDAALGKPHGSDARLGKRTYVSAFGLERARELAAESHRKARAALALAAPGGAAELEQIADFIVTRTS